MTKLEQKLIELGYKLFQQKSDREVIYRKVNIGGYLDIQLWNGNILTSGVLFPLPINTQYELNNIQQAFNQLQNDLKELKEYE
jgi:hypothetical protein